MAISLTGCEKMESALGDVPEVPKWIAGLLIILFVRNKCFSSPGLILTKCTRPSKNSVFVQGRVNFASSSVIKKLNWKIR